MSMSPYLNQTKTKLPNECVSASHTNCLTRCFFFLSHRRQIYLGQAAELQAASTSPTSAEAPGQTCVATTTRLAARTRHVSSPVHRSCVCLSTTLPHHPNAGVQYKAALPQRLELLHTRPRQTSSPQQLRFFVHDTTAPPPIRRRVKRGQVTLTVKRDLPGRGLRLVPSQLTSWHNQRRTPRTPRAPEGENEALGQQ